MPKRPTAAKTVAKKPAAKKTAAPAKKTPAKKSASANNKGKPATVDGLAFKIVEAIKNGDLDGHMEALDNAITERINRQSQNRAAKKTAAKKTGDAKKVSTAPKRVKKDEAVTPEPGKTYKVASRIKKFGGAKVKFVRFKSDDDTKAMIEMLVDKPGYPKGKRIVIPVSALTN